MTPPDLAERIVAAIRPIVRLHGVDAYNVDGDILTNAVRALLPQAGEDGLACGHPAAMLVTVETDLSHVRGCAACLLKMHMDMEAERQAGIVRLEQAGALLRDANRALTSPSMKAVTFSAFVHGVYFDPKDSRDGKAIDAFLSAHPPAPEPAP